MPTTPGKTTFTLFPGGSGQGRTITFPTQPTTPTNPPANNQPTGYEVPPNPITGQQGYSTTNPAAAFQPGAKAVYKGGGTSGYGDSSSASSSSSQGVVVQTPQGGVSYPTQAAALTAQQALDKATKASRAMNTISDTYGKSNLYTLKQGDIGYVAPSVNNLPGGVSSYGPARDINQVNPNRFIQGLGTRGLKPLTIAEQNALSQLQGGKGFVVSPGVYSPTATGRGTTFTGPDLSKATKYDIANQIVFNAQNKVNDIVAKEQAVIINQLKPSYEQQVKEAQAGLQANVDAGLIDVNVANDKLKEITDNINTKFSTEVANKVNANVDSSVKAINKQSAIAVKQYNVSPEELEKKVGKIEAVTGISPETIRNAAEIGAVVVASAINPALGIGVSGAIAGTNLVQAASEYNKSTPILEITKDKFGNTNVVQVGTKFTPEFYSRATSALAFGVPAVGGAISGISKELTTAEALRLAGKRELTIEELQAGKFIQKVPNFITGEIQEVPITIKNANKILKYQDLINNPVQGVGNVKFVSAGTIEQENVVKTILSNKDFKAALEKNGITIEQLQAEKRITLGTIKNAYGKEEKIYGITTSLQKGEGGKQFNIYFRMRGNQIVQPRVVTTELKTGEYTLYRFAKSGELKTYKVPIKGNVNPIEIQEAFRLRTLRSGVIKTKSEISLEELEKAIKINIERKSANIKTGVRVKGEGSPSIVQALYGPQVTKKVTPELLSVSQSEKLNVFPKDLRGLRVDVDTLSKELKLTLKQRGYTIEKGIIKEIPKGPKPIDFYIKKTPSLPFEMSAGPKTFVPSPAKNIISKQSKDIENAIDELGGVPKMVGGKGTVQSMYDMELSQGVLEPIINFKFGKIPNAIVNRKALIDAEKAAGSNIFESLTAKDLGIKTNIKPINANLYSTGIGKVYAKPLVGVNYLYPDIKSLNKVFVNPQISYNNLIKSSSLDLVKPISESKIDTITGPGIRTATAPATITNINLGPITTPIVVPKIEIPPFKIPTIKYPTPPFPVIDIPFGFGLPGRPSWQLGESTQYRKNIYSPSKPPKYAASLGSALFGLSVKVKQKDLARTLKKLSSQTYTGIEQRPTIEVVPNKPIKKVNIKKIYKTLNL